ncbi:MAG: DUF697 domain-containing protein [Myxococcaceae bacterium]|nr:DUF697 domain-containing protein [Myxococcaceae bacterium]
MSTEASADSVIRQHVYWSVGAGLVPVPIADFVAVTAVQLDLIRQLCTLYGVSYEEGTGKVWVGALTGGAVARLGASAIKAIPGIGSILGAVSMSIASGASTYAVGQVVKSHLMGGGTMANLDVERRRVPEAREAGEAPRLGRHHRGRVRGQEGRAAEERVRSTFGTTSPRLTR